MRIFDPHIHMTSRTTDDYRAMYEAGVRALVEPVFLARPAAHLAGELLSTTSTRSLAGSPFRASQYGIAHHCTIALNPKEANDPRCVPVLDELPRYLVKDGVVAVGEIGYDSMTPAEDTALAAQLELAAGHGLPALVHTPHRDKLVGLRRTLDVVAESKLPVDAVLIDHLNETTVKEATDSGAWLGFSVYPDTKMDEHRMVAVLKEFGPEQVLVNSAADWGKSDPLKTRRVADAMLDAGFGEDEVDRVLWRNPVAFYGQSGRLDPRARRARGAARGQLPAARRRMSHALHPPRRLDRASRVLHQRPPGRDPRRCPRPARRPLRTGPAAPGLERLGIGLWLARDAVRALNADPAALRRLRTELTGAASKSSPSMASPIRASGPRRSSTGSTGLTGPTRCAWSTPPTWPGCSPGCCRPTSPRAPSPPCRWRGAPATTRPRPVGAHGAGRTRPAPGRTWSRAGRPSGSPSSPSPAAWWRPPPTRWPRWPPCRATGIGLCLDTCHLATSFEEPAARPRRPGTAGIPVPKVQLSAALHAEDPHGPAVRAALAAFDEPRFLHQTRAKAGAGLHGTDDLGEALAGGALPDTVPWRAHFHVPLHAPPAPPLASTLGVLRETLTALGRRAHRTHATTSRSRPTPGKPCPPRHAPRPDARLADGIAAELDLARSLLTDLGLKEQQ